MNMSRSRSFAGEAGAWRSPPPFSIQLFQQPMNGACSFAGNQNDGWQDIRQDSSVGGVEADTSTDQTHVLAFAAMSALIEVTEDFGSGNRSRLQRTRKYKFSANSDEAVAFREPLRRAAISRDEPK